MQRCQVCRLVDFVRLFASVRDLLTQSPQPDQAIILSDHMFHIFQLSVRSLISSARDFLH